MAPLLEWTDLTQSRGAMTTHTYTMHKIDQSRTLGNVSEAYAILHACTSIYVQRAEINKQLTDVSVKGP